MEHAELMRELNRIMAYIYDDEPKQKIKETGKT